MKPVHSINPYLHTVSHTHTHTLTDGALVQYELADSYVTNSPSSGSSTNETRESSEV